MGQVEVVVGRVQRYVQKSEVVQIWPVTPPTACCSSWNARSRMVSLLSASGFLIFFMVVLPVCLRGCVKLLVLVIEVMPARAMSGELRSAWDAR
jgi:hypothetical protein